MKKFLSRLAAVIAAMSLSLTAFTGCGSQAESKESSNTEGQKNVSSAAETSAVGEAAKTDTASNEKVTVRLCDMTAADTTGGIIFSYADHAGIIEKNFEGLNVDYVIANFESGPAQNEAFASGSIDFSSMGNMPAFTGVSNDYGYKILAINCASEEWAALVASNDSGIASLEDLKGKRVGTYIGGTWHYATGLYLKSVGLTLDDIELLNTTSETATGIRSGELDAGVLSPATAQQLKDEGSGTVIAINCGDPSSEAMCGAEAICGATEFTSKYPEITQAVLKIVDESLHHADENPEDYLAFFEEKTVPIRPHSEKHGI